MLKRFFQASLKQAKILHITDNEGTPFFFDSLKKSSIVKYQSDKGLTFQKTKGEPYFVFGGDATDRGPYDLATLELLLDFKRRHPDNVFLLAGNREIKQNRFKVELAENLIRQRLLHTTPPRWRPPLVPSVPLEYVKTAMQAAGKNAEDSQAIQDYVASLSIAQCQLIYLRWMLEKNMGCLRTFRYRREEIQKRLQKENVSDEEVLQSFLQEVAPHGLISEYFQNSQLGVIIPDTQVLAIHGALTPENFGRVPDMAPAEKPLASAVEWLNRFNAWYKIQIQKWLDYVPTELTQPGFSALDESVVPIPGKIKYIVTADMLGKEREFIGVSPLVSQYLFNNKINVVLMGHQPCGDHPAIFRSASQPILFIENDTGYAKGDLSNPDDTRGKACHTLEITADAMQTHIHIQAILLDGVAVTTDLTVTAEKITGDKYIGKVLPDNFLVQCRLADGNYRLANQKKYQVSYSVVSEHELKNKLESLRPSS